MDSKEVFLQIYRDNIHRVNDFVPYLKHDPTSKQIRPVPIHSLPCFVRYKTIIDFILTLCK